MKKVLITGITGFVGKHLTTYLKEQENEVELYGTTRSLVNREDTTFKDVTLLNAELTAEKDIDNVIATVKPDEVYHLAALSSPAESFKSPAQTISNNVNAEIFLLEALRKHNLLQTKVLIVATSDMYGIVQANDLPIDEDTPFNPTSPYAVSKITQDYLAFQYFMSYKMPIIRVRPFAHVGPEQTDRFVLATFAKQIALIEKGSQEPVLKVGNLEAKRDFTDVRDMVKAYTILMDKGVFGDVYNVGSGTSRRIKDVLDQMLALSSVAITTEEDPKRMRPSDIPELRCNYNKMHALTGWKPEIPFETTLKDILDYWREEVGKE